MGLLSSIAPLDRSSSSPSFRAAAITHEHSKVSRSAAGSRALILKSQGQPREVFCAAGDAGSAAPPTIHPPMARNDLPPGCEEKRWVDDDETAVCMRRRAAREPNCTMPSMFLCAAWTGVFLNIFSDFWHNSGPDRRAVGSRAGATRCSTRRAGGTTADAAAASTAARARPTSR